MIGNISYYYLASPLLYLTFLGAYLHPGCCKLLFSRWSCCAQMRYDSIVADDALYDYQPVDTLPTVKHWIPPSQLNISSPYYPRHTNSGVFSTTSWSEAEFSTTATDASSTSDSAPNTTAEDDDYEYVGPTRLIVN